MWKCGKCHADLNAPTKECSQGHETGIPTNVCLANQDEPKLHERFESCLAEVDDTLRTNRLARYQQTVCDNLSVSINVRAGSLVNFMSDERIRYVNLHDNLRANAVLNYDKELANKRTVIDGMAFKADGQKLNFGAVNLGNNTGLISYGEVCIILNSDEIRSRVSFLENNVFSYYSESGGAIRFEIPAGSRALWHSLGELALVKHAADFFGADELSCDQISRLLLHSNGDKATDQYIEAQIFPPITRATISRIIVNLKAWRKVNDKSLVGKTEEHLQELSSRAKNFIKYFRDEVQDNVPSVPLEFINATEN